MDIYFCNIDAKLKLIEQARLFQANRCKTLIKHQARKIQALEEALKEKSEYSHQLEAKNNENQIVIQKLRESQYYMQQKMQQETALSIAAVNRESKADKNFANKVIKSIINEQSPPVNQSFYSNSSNLVGLITREIPFNNKQFKKFTLDKSGPIGYGGGNNLNASTPFISLAHQSKPPKPANYRTANAVSAITSRSRKAGPIKYLF